MLPRILCIDDEAHNNEAIERLLRKKYRVLTTISPQEGLKLIEEHQPALIISDQRMPQMTGVELLKKSIPLSPESVRLLLTGYTDLESVITAINEGQIYRYLTKPWEPTDLQVTVDKAYETFLLRQELKAQNEILKSLDKLKTDFMLLVSHELKTPLTGISSFVQLLKEEIKNQEQKSYVAHIEKNTQRLQKLIEDILSITQIKTTAAGVTPQSIDVAMSIDKIWKDLAAKGMTLHCRLESPVSNIEVDAKLWEDLLKRVFSNCYQHAAPDSEVLVEMKEDEHNYQLSVSNVMQHTLTVSPQSLISAFTKNEKIMNHTQGTGLGLSVVDALSQALGGTLKISARDKKFHVKITFPKKS